MSKIAAPRKPVGRFEPYAEMRPAGDCLEITVKNGRSFLIDTADADLIKDYIWHTNRSGTRCYVNGRSLLERDSTGAKKKVALHRLLTEAPAGILVDHINGNTLDNRRSNLRLCTSRENIANAKKRSDVATSIYKGVHKRPGLKKPWRATIKNIKPTPIHLGYFQTEALAALAYDRAAIRVFGDFAKTNFPRDLIAHIDGLEAWAEHQKKGKGGG